MQISIDSQFFLLGPLIWSSTRAHFGYVYFVSLHYVQSRVLIIVFSRVLQKNYKAGAQPATNNAYNEECDYHHQPTGRLGVIESSAESVAQDSSVSDLGNQDTSIIDSIPERYPQNDCIISSHGGSTESVNTRT